MTWEKAKLGEVCIIEKGNIGIMKAIPGEYPLVVLGEQRKTHNEFQFDDDAVIVPLVSSTGHGHRSMKRIFLQTGKFSVGSILCAVIPKDKTKLSAEFLYRYLDFNKEKELVSRMRGMANVSLPMKEIADVEIPLPPIEHQIKLIEEFQKLETANNQITTELSHQLELVRQLRQAFLREAMQGKFVPQDTADETTEILLEKIKAEKEKLIAEKRIKKDKPLPEIKPEEIPFEIPNNWTWCRLGEIANNVEYGTSEKGDLNSNDIAVLRMNNIQSGKVLIENLKYVKATIEDLPRLYLKNNDLLFNRTNSYELVGKAGVFKGESDKLTFASYLIRVQFSDFVSVDFANYYINSIQCRETQIEPDIIQQNGQANFNGTKLKNIIVPLPPLAEQKRIVEKLEKLMKFCDELEANIRESKSNAESLLQVALKEALEPKK